jgi:hypothetical protein
LTVWVSAEVVASAVFLHLASWRWLEQNLRGREVARSGDALVWTSSAFPILVVATLANLLWRVLMARERRKSETPWPISATFLVAFIWACAMTMNGPRSAGF